MLRYFIWILLIMPAMAQSQSSLLYKISGNGVKGPCYLAGTMHLVCNPDELVDQYFIDALKKCDVLIMEVDLAEKSQIFKLASMSLLPSGKSLYNYLKPAQVDSVKKYFKDSLGINLTDAHLRMKPFVLSSLPYTKYTTCKKKGAIDESIYKIGKKRKMKIVGLETLVQQLSFFDTIPYSLQAEALMDVVRNPTDYKNAFLQMEKCYTDGNLNCVMDTDAAMTDTEDDSVYTDMLLIKRNKRWMDDIMYYITSGKTFIAVGAAHLPGPYGLITLLREKGFTVEPVY